MLVLQQLVPAGSKVKKGEVVAEFDRQYMLLRLDDYRATVFQSEASLKKQKADLEISRKAHQQLIDSAKADLEKARLDMKTLPVLSAIDSERTQLALQQAEARYKQLLAEVPFVRASEDADVRIAELDLEQAKLELKRAQANADKMIVKAPIDGLTVMQNIFRGAEFAQVQQGDQLWPGMNFMQIVDPRSMVVNASLSQVDVQKIRLGAKAKVHFDAYPALVLPARVESVGAITKPGNMRAQFVKEIPVRLRIEGVDPRVIPDLSVSAEVVLEAEPNSTVVPVEAVFSSEPGEPAAPRTPFVYVRQPFGWERRSVRLGLSNAITVAVKNGLSKDEEVALERPVAAGGS